MTAPVRARRTAPARPRPRPGPAAGRRPPLHVVPPAPRHRARHPRLLPVAAAMAVAVALLGLVAAHAALARGQFRLQDLERRADAEQARYERLRLDVARLEAPAHIVAVAQQRLGMVPPAAVTYLSPVGPSTASSTAPPVTAGRAEATPGSRDPDLASATTRWSDVKRQLGRR